MNMLYLLIIMSSLIMSGCFSSPTEEEEKEEKMHMLWQYAYDFDGGAPRAKPLINGDKIITSGDAKITALDYRTGETIWKTPYDFNIQLMNASFGVIDNIIAGNIPDKILSWDIGTGDVLWEVELDDSINLGKFIGITGTDISFIAVGRAELLEISKEGELTIYNQDVRSYESSYYNNILYVNQRKGDPGVGIFSAYDFSTMELLWQFEPGAFGFGTSAAPIIENGIVYTGTTGGPADSKYGFFALDASTGEELWRREGILTYSAVLVGDYIYIHDAAGIYKLQKSDGTIVWYADFDAGNGTAPIDYGYGYLYAPHSGTMHVVDAGTGEIVHRISPPDGSYFWRVTVGAGRVFAQSNQKLYAFSPWGYEEPLKVDN